MLRYASLQLSNHCEGIVQDVFVTLSAPVIDISALRVNDRAVKVNKCPASYKKSNKNAFADLHFCLDTFIPSTGMQQWVEADKRYHLTATKKVVKGYSHWIRHRRVRCRCSWWACGSRSARPWTWPAAPPVAHVTRSVPDTTAKWPAAGGRRWRTRGWQESFCGSHGLTSRQENSFGDSDCPYYHFLAIDWSDNIWAPI